MIFFQIYLSPGPPVILCAIVPYNTKPVSSAKTPFQIPISSVEGINFASCIQESTANIIPKEDSISQTINNLFLFSDDVNQIPFPNFNVFVFGY